MSLRSFATEARARAEATAEPARVTALAAAATMAARTAAPERRAGPLAPTLRVATTAAPTIALGRPAAQVRWTAQGRARLAIQTRPERWVQIRRNSRTGSRKRPRNRTAGASQRVLSLISSNVSHAARRCCLYEREHAAIGPLTMPACPDLVTSPPRARIVCISRHLENSEKFDETQIFRHCGAYLDSELSIRRRRRRNRHIQRG